MTEETHDKKDYQPNSYYCFVCGVKNDAGLHVRFVNDGPGQVRVDTQICKKHQGYPGIAHGGVSAALLDETMGRASMSGYHGDNDSKEKDSIDRFLYTARMELRYRKPVPLDTPITVKGRIVEDKGRKVTATGEIILPDGTVAVEGRAILIAVPGEHLDSMFEKDELGWRVYDEDEYEKWVKPGCDDE